MNLTDLFIKIAVKDEASDKIGSVAKNIGSGLKTAANVGVAAMSVAASSIAALTAAAVKNYAEYEQLVGGAELMFGNAFNTVMQNSKNAYKTVQMSQNEYLTQVNGFATGLKTALGGNEEAAANLAHRIIKAEADIVAATGVTQDMVQNAFNGVMKSNFTMLDNLQIGITPTKEGFQEVIDKVNEWNTANGNATRYQMGNLADMQSALVDYVSMVGMSNYAQDEAMKTITGSMSAAKAAWKNLVTGVADDTADFDGLVNSFVESAGTAASNILPRVSTALKGAAKLITAIIPEVVGVLPELIGEVLPEMATAAVGIIEALVSGLSENAELLMDSAFQVIMTITNGILTLLPQIIQLGLTLIVTLATGLAQNAPTLIPAILECAMLIVDTLVANAPLLLAAGVELIAALLVGLAQMLPEVVSWIFTVPGKLAEAIVKNAPRLLSAGKNLIQAFLNGLYQAFGSVIVFVAEQVNYIIGLINNAIAAVGGLFGMDNTLTIKTIDVEGYKQSKGLGQTNNTYNIYGKKQTAAELIRDTKYINNRKVLEEW